MTELKCKHDGDYFTRREYIECICGAIKTDNLWGLASNNWFKSVEEAEYYQKHGKYPEPIREI